ncbi:MAG: type II toxin-antitoxin system VapC family toxin [Deltaproteobacteria bacterium]|nr:type II toxin-antitoxin system VapC family toxin [Deltaproteobacteria bacterium]
MLLDTCALLWLVHDRSRLSAETLQKMDEAPLLYVSAITGFEIALKTRAGKLELPMPAVEWFHGVVEHYALSVIDLDLAICIKATELPPIHRDPCDRFIIATALLRDLPIVTVDSRFPQYGVKTLQ